MKLHQEHLMNDTWKCALWFGIVSVALRLSHLLLVDNSAQIDSILLNRKLRYSLDRSVDLHGGYLII